MEIEKDIAESANGAFDNTTANTNANRDSSGSSASNSAIAAHPDVSDIENNLDPNDASEFGTISMPSKISRRRPSRPQAYENDIYVTREKYKMESQLKRAKSLLLNKKYTFVTIHALGAAIGHAIILATQLRERMHDQVTIDTDISATTVYDDILSANEAHDIRTSTRKTPTIAIKISLKDHPSSETN